LRPRGVGSNACAAASKPFESPTPSTSPIRTFARLRCNTSARSAVFTRRLRTTWMRSTVRSHRSPQRRKPCLTNSRCEAPAVKRRSTPYDEDGRVDVRRRHKRSSRQRPASTHLPCAQPTVRSRRSAGGVAPDHSPLEHEIGRNKPRTRAQQNPHQRGGNRIWRVCDYPERAAGQPKARRVHPDNGDRCAGEPAPELLCSAGMQLDGNDICPVVQQLCGNGAGPCANVDD
jgi:hypothetical protein